MLGIGTWALLVSGALFPESCQYLHPVLFSQVHGIEPPTPAPRPSEASLGLLGFSRSARSWHTYVSARGSSITSFSIALFMKVVLCNEPETAWISPDWWHDLSVPDRLYGGKGKSTVMLFLLAGITQSLIARLKIHWHFLVRSFPWKHRELQFQMPFI